MTDIEQAQRIIGQNHDSIIKNIKEIDIISAQITELFFPWKNFLRISADLNNKLIQISKEQNIINDKNKHSSIIEIYNFSKENKFNIFIIFFHGYLYMFSYSIIIPFYTSIFSYKDNIKKDKDYIWWGVLLMMTPLGTLINYFYETIFFYKSTKIPIIISCIGIMIGNLLYSFAPFFDSLFLLFLGRFFIGLFNLRTHNKMYIINFLLKKDVSFYLTMFHAFSMVGLGSGFLLNCILLFINIDNKKINIIINKFTSGTLFASFLSFILLILTIVLFTEAHSQLFNVSSLQMFGDGIINDIENEDNIPINKINDNNNNENILKRHSKMIKNINEELGDFNKKNQFDDTNLVSKSIYELANKEEDSLNYLFKAFIIYLFIIFTTKFINESIYINSFIFNGKIKINEVEDNSWKISLGLGCACFLSLLIELSLSCKHLFISEKKLLLILLTLLLINNGSLVLFLFLNKN